MNPRIRRGTLPATHIAVCTGMSGRGNDRCLSLAGTENVRLLSSIARIGGGIPLEAPA